MAVGLVYLLVFSLTARQTMAVAVGGFFVPVLVGVIVLRATRPVAGVILAVSIPLSLVAIVYLITLGLVTPGS